MDAMVKLMGSMKKPGASLQEVLNSLLRAVLVIQHLFELFN